MIKLIRAFWTKSIRRQLMLGIALVHAVLMTIFVVDLVKREQLFLMELSHKQAVGLSQMLAANGSSWVLASDFIGMEEVIESQSDFPNLKYALFTDLQGKVLAFSDRQKVGLYMSDTISLKLIQASPKTQIMVDNYLEIDVASPIMAANSQIGWARVKLSRNSILNNLNIVTRDGIIYTLFAITIGIIFAWLMAKGLTLGVKKLVDGVVLLAKGNRLVDFDLNRHDELGDLSAAMNNAMQEMARTEGVILQQAERTRVTLRSIGDGVITTYSNGKVEYLNPIAEKLTGWSNEEAHNQDLQKIFRITNEISGEIVVNPVEKVLRDNVIIGLANHTALAHRDGNIISIEDSAAPIHDIDGNIIGVVLVFHDASNERTLQNKMTHQATHDSLTGIWNRAAFEKRLEELQGDSTSLNVNHALLYIDLDQFKIVNDTAGHTAGDEMLKQITQEFERIVRNSDMLARIGGDEFAVLLKNCDQEHSQRVAEHLRKTIEKYKFVWENVNYQVGVSIGISMITPQSRVTDVMSQADLACYKAKGDGRNCVHFYSESDKELSARFGEMHWVSKINEALEKNRFILYSQKISKIKSSPTELDYREVLVRLKGDSNEIILPNSFIPAAERYGLMSKIDKFVIDETCNWLANRPIGSIKLSINLSGQSLGDKDFLKYIETKLQQQQHFTKFIVFEITETAAISNLRVAINFMERLSHLGIEFSLDDFGSGLSSFAYLKNMPVSYIKIDGGFVRDMATDAVDAAMVHAIAQIGNKLGMETIAEFVECEETLVLLAEYGVTFAQGYHLEKPKPLL